MRYLGLSNTYSLSMLRAVYDAATVKPSFVQNRFYADSGYDIELRAYCRANEIRYQSFWTLTANPHILGRYEVLKQSVNTTIVITFD